MKKEGIAVVLMTIVLLSSIMLVSAQEYDISGDREQSQESSSDEQEGSQLTYAQEKEIVRENYYQVEEHQKKALAACKRYSHETAISEIDAAFELSYGLEYVNNAYNNLEALAKICFLCASYQKQEDMPQYIIEAGKSIEAAMEKAEQYIMAHEIRAAQMFYLSAGLWEKMRYQARGLGTKYDTKYTCEMELFCLETAKQLNYPQADIALNKLATKQDCIGYSAVEPGEQAPEQSEERQEQIEELLGQAEEIKIGTPEALAEEQVPEVTATTPDIKAPDVGAQKGKAKTLLILLIISILAVIAIVSAVLLGIRKHHHH